MKFTTRERLGNHVIVTDAALQQLCNKTVPLKIESHRIGSAKVVGVRQSGQFLEFDIEVDDVLGCLVGADFPPGSFAIR